MASSSSNATPLAVEFKDRPCIMFKKNPYKSMEVNPVGAFSSISHEVLHIVDVRAYIHYEIEETGNEDILDIDTDNIMDEINNPKLEFVQLQRKGFTQFVNFL